MTGIDTILKKLSLRHILLAGALLRLCAVFFSPGYAFHDDHFEMPELVFRWQHGISFLWTGSNVHVFSLIYPGMMYGLFKACNAVGITAPEDMMLVVRFVHAAFSLLTIYYGAKLAARLGAGEEAVKLVALALALFWIFPFMSVRNLREFFCVPFLVIGCYHLADPRLTSKSIAWGALFFAISFSIRLQVVFIPVGIGAGLLLRKEYRLKAVLFAIAFCIAYMLTQGMFDLLYYGDPFANLKEYYRFNANPVNIELQPQGPWYQYIGTVAGVVWGIPFFWLLAGFYQSRRLSFQALVLLIACLFFFVFHSWYSNKQERFILPFIPLFLLLGIAGFVSWYRQAPREKWLRRLTRFAIIWFLVFNTAGLLVLTFTYSKRSRIESMIYLRKKSDVQNIVMEGEVSLQRPPLFYLGKHLETYALRPGDPADTLRRQIDAGDRPSPNYVIMAGNHEFEQRLARLREVFPGIKEEAVIKTSFVDNLAHWLNPKHNQNEDWYIYRTQ